jgi:hypothetical protein
VVVVVAAAAEIAATVTEKEKPGLNPGFFVGVPLLCHSCGNDDLEIVVPAEAGTHAGG